MTEKICVCQKNFTQVADSCRRGAGLGGRCRVNAECLERAKNTVCLDHKCICARGFIARKNQSECLAVAGYGQPCSESGQCQQSLGFGGVCDNGLCVCDASHVNVSLGNIVICEKRIAVGDTCKEHGQCYHSYPLEQTMECIGGHCQCIEGFSEENRQCVENSVDCVKIVSPILLLISLIVHKILN
uniref:EB domain-containing protein n=1 Tax=Phlebotomus papatasi TaxID=29031 RepID=A0A1B0DPK8_PHLPP